MAPKKVRKHGQDRWMIDLRQWGQGRQYHRTREAAALALSSAREERARFGELAFELSHEERIRYLSIQTRLAGLGATLEQVVDFFDAHHRAQTPKPLKEAVSECLAAKEAAKRKPRTIQQLRYTLDSLKTFIGDQDVSYVTAAHLDRWLDSEDWSATTRLHRLIDARTFFSFCVRRGWLSNNPALAAEPITVDRKAPGILTVDQARKLMEACLTTYPGAVPFFALGLFCGIRPSEILALSWAQVDLKGGWVEIPETIAKGRRHRLIKLQPATLAWLDLGGDLPPVNWQDRWDAVREAAGIDPWPHDAMRHSFCSYALPIFGAQQTALWAGHSEGILFEKYRGRPIRQEDAEAFWAILPTLD